MILEISLHSDHCIINVITFLYNQLSERNDGLFHSIPFPFGKLSVDRVPIIYTPCVIFQVCNRLNKTKKISNFTELMF